MTDIRSAQDVSLKDENTNEFMYGSQQGNSVPSTNLFATDAYGQYNSTLPTIANGRFTSLQTDANGRLITTSYSGPGSSTHVIIDDALNPTAFQMAGANIGTNVANTNLFASVAYGMTQAIPRPTVDIGKYTPLQLDSSGRLVVTSEQGGPSLHIIIDDTKNPLLFQAEVHPDNYLKTKALGAPMLYDNFSAIAGFDNAKWLSTLTSGGTYTQTDARLDLATTTTSGSLSKIESRGFWEFFAGSTQTLYANIRFSATQPTNNYKLWGLGSAENDGVFFKLVGANMYACHRFNGTESLHALDLTNVPTVLTNGFIHEYKIITKDTSCYWYIDGYSVYREKATTQDLFRYARLKVIVENENTGLSSGASNLYVHNIGLFDDTTTQVVIGRSNLGLRVTNELLIDNVAYSVVVGGTWRRLLTYPVPGQNIAEIMAMRSSNSTSSGRSRCISRVDLATYSWTTGSPGTFTDQNYYEPPRYGSAIEAVQTVASGGGADVTVTITYTNQAGITGRTATISIPKSSVIGSRYIATLQAGDFGVIDVTAVSHSGNNTGGLEIFGTTQLTRHFHGTADLVSETVFAKESVMVTGNDIIDLEVWQANAGSYVRFMSVIYTIS